MDDRAYTLMLPAQNLKKTPPVELFLVLPGLNLHPARMLPLAAVLQDCGYGLVHPRLAGFPSLSAPASSCPAWNRVRAVDWLQALDDVQARLRARFPATRLSLLGYSMGGVLGLAWSLSRRQVLERAVLISPALRLRWPLRPALRALCALLPSRLRLPSLGPAPYLAQRGTSIAAYEALLMLQNGLAPALKGALQGEAPLPAGLPAGQFMAWHAQDELIATGYLAHYSERITAKVSMTTHRFQHTRQPGLPCHLGIDRESLGPSEWAALQSALERWLTTPLRR